MRALPRLMMDIPVTERERKHLGEHVDRCELRWKQTRLLLFILGFMILGGRLTQMDVLHWIFPGLH